MSDMVTVRDLLLEHPPCASYVYPPSKPVLTKKGWTDEYHSIPNPTIHEPTVDSINQFLASEQYSPNSNSVYTADPSDHYRLDKMVHKLNYLDVEHIVTEGDVTRDFYMHIGLPVSIAWQKKRNFLQRSLSGPPGPTSTNKTVDHLYSWIVEGDGLNERCQIIGEFKQPGVILVGEWQGRSPQTDMTTRLGKELRAYASEYACPHAFVYDGVHLLVVQFKAKDAEDIKSLQCRVDCCVLARTPEVAQCSARFALYRLAWRGWMRMTGEWSADVRVSVGGWRREFRYWSGRPGWVNEQDPRRKELDHPDGYMRRFDLTSNTWYWVDIQGNPIFDVYNNTIWDSRQSWP